jgi:RNA polymerase sigma-70 factor, ECF subfamily
MQMAAIGKIEELYDRHATALYAFALNLTRHEADASDIIQELFTRIARDPDLFHHVRNERPFLLRMTHHLAIDHIRRRASRDRLAEALAAETDEPFAPSTDPDEQNFRVELAQALEKLPPEQRAVVHLKIWEDLTFEEIAEALETSPNTAASRYRYGLDKLRAWLRPILKELL